MSENVTVRRGERFAQKGCSVDNLASLYTTDFSLTVSYQICTEINFQQLRRGSYFVIEVDDLPTLTTIASSLTAHFLARYNKSDRSYPIIKNSYYY
jgi:hypothetical protein